MRKESSPFGEQLTNPPASSGADATKNIRCCPSHAASSGEMPSYTFPTQGLAFRKRPLCHGPGAPGLRGEYARRCLRTSRTYSLYREPRDRTEDGFTAAANRDEHLAACRAVVRIRVLRTRLPGAVAATAGIGVRRHRARGRHRPDGVHGRIGDRKLCRRPARRPCDRAAALVRRCGTAHWRHRAVYAVALSRAASPVQTGVFERL